MGKFAPALQSATHTCTQNVEFSVVKNATFNSAAPQTTVGKVWVKLDTTAVVSGDVCEVRRYIGVAGGTLTQIDTPFTIKAGQEYEPVEFLGGSAWDVTVKITTATSRLIGFEVYQDQGDVNVATIAAGAVTSIQSGLALAATALSTAQWTNPRAANLDNLDGTVSSRAAQTDVTTLLGRLTSGRATLLDNLSNLDAAISVLTGRLTSGRATLLDNLDATVSTRATSTALATVQTGVTDVQTRLPAALVGGRMSSDVGSWLGTAAATPTVAGVPKVEDATLQARLTSGRATNLDNLTNLDAAVSSRAPLSTALSTAQWTNPRAALIDNLSNVDVATSSRAPATTALSNAQWTNARAGFVDNLNVGGNVASSAEVVAVQNNTRVVRVVPPSIERPDSGTTTYRVELLLYDSVGNMEAPDAAPTVALVNQTGTDLSSRLDSTTMSLVSVGRYRSIYTASVSDALEQLVWTFSVVEGGATRLYGNTSLIVDETAVDFTATDRTKLNQLATDLTTSRAGKLDFLVAPAASQASVDAIQADTDDVQARLPATLDGAGNIRAAVQSVATGAIVAASLAANSLTASALASDAVAEIQTGLATSTALATVQTGVTDVQTRLPATLVGGRMSSDVGSWLGTAAATPTVAGVPKVEDATLQARLTSGRATNLDNLTNLDAAVSSRAPLSTALSTAQWTNPRAALIDNLSNVDVAVSTRAASTSLATVQTNVTDIQARLPAALVSGRISSDVGSWLGTAAATPTVAGVPKVEDATLQARLTSGRATNLDNLINVDVATSTRAPAISAVSSADLTPTRAAQLDTLPGITASVADVQARLPSTLDSGNMRSSVETMTGGVVDAIVSAIFNFVIEAGGDVKARTFLQRLRIKWSVFAGNVSGLSITAPSTEHFRDATNAKDRAVFQLNLDGTRVADSFDGD